MARLRAASRRRGWSLETPGENEAEWPSAAGCARVSVNRAATIPAPSVARETLWSTSSLRSSSCTSSSERRDASRASDPADGRKAAARRSTAESTEERRG
eukprot:545900-Pleurochrysis_carterae.AAC.2